MALPPALFTRLCVCIDDPKAWSECLPYLETLPLSASGPFYSRALALYPSTGPVVLSAVKAHSTRNDPAGVQRILYSHLERTPYPPLWAYYCGFVEGQKLQPALASLEAAQRASAASAATASPSAGAAAAAAAAADVASATAALTAAQQRVRECREEVLQAYKFAVDRVGGLWGAEVVYQAYIAFTQTLPVDGAFNLGYARESQREALLKASTSAHSFTDAAWEAYTTFERGGGAASKLSDALIAKALKAHTLASEASKQRGGLWGGVDLARLPGSPREVVGGESGEVLFSLPSSASVEGGSSALNDWQQGTRVQSLAWRAVIGFELTNPLALDAPALEAAVTLMFTAALGGPMRTCPEVWYEFALFKGLSSKGGRGFEVLKQAMGVLPTCATLALAAADAYEALGQWEEANSVVGEVVGELGRVADGCGRLHALALRAAIGSSSGREEGVGGSGSGSGSSSSASAASATLPSNSPPPPMFAALDALLRGESEEEAWREAGIPNPPPYCLHPQSGAAPPSPPLPTLLSRAIATPSDALLAASAIPGVYIVQQRRVRRCQGAEAAREVFSQARKSPYVTPDVYLASARLEYFSNGRNIAVPRNILEAGRKRFPAATDFLASACDFLALHDDSDSARGFIEGVLGGLGGVGGGLGGSGSGSGSGSGTQPSQTPTTRPFWDRLLALELTLCPGGGSLEGVKEVERRRGEAHPYLIGEETRPLQRLIHRWAVFEGGAAPPSTWVDRDLCGRFPVAPGATLPVKVYAIGGGEEEESGSSWGRIVHMDGLHLQVSRELGVPPNTFESATAAAASRGSGVGASTSGKVYSIPPLPPPPPPPPTTQAPHTSAPPPPLPPVIVPAFLAPFLSKLPAFAPELGPIPSVDALIQSLSAFKEVYEEEEVGKESGGMESVVLGEGSGAQGGGDSSGSTSSKRARVEE